MRVTCPVHLILLDLITLCLMKSIIYEAHYSVFSTIPPIRPLSSEPYFQNTLNLKRTEFSLVEQSFSENV